MIEGAVLSYNKIECSSLTVTVVGNADMRMDFLTADTRVLCRRGNTGWPVVEACVAGATAAAAPLLAVAVVPVGFSCSSRTTGNN